MNVQYIIHLIEPLKIKPGHAGILLFLRKAGPLSQREIADHIGVKPPSVTKLITELPSVEVKRSFVPVARRLPFESVMLFEVVT